MRESYREGLASHSGPESCAVGREAGSEALTGVWVGRVLSREIFASEAPTRSCNAEGNI